MASARRIRIFFVGIIVFVVLTLMYTSSLRSASTPDTRSIQDFYHRTANTIDRTRKGGSSGTQAILGVGQQKTDTDGDGDVDAEDKALAMAMSNRLKEAEAKAKEAANAKAPNKPDPPKKLVGVGSSAGGQKDKDHKKETEEEHVVETTINEILKKSPVIIFSKSYCQFSKKAKALLLEKYSIEPTPYVVELDLHPLGKQVQQRLADMTGRKTVPNILINGRSIGGSDDIAALEANDELVDRIKTLGGKRVSMTLQKDLR